MNRNYETPRVSPEWASSRETDMAVAVAIHAIADSSRSAEAIWEEPTEVEWSHVQCAIHEYVRHGDFPSAPGSKYHWGEAIVAVQA